MEKNNSIGCLWEKEGKAGKYMSGNIEVGGNKINIVVFKNTHKKSDKHPDWNILISKPREEKTDALDLAWDEEGHGQKKAKEAYTPF